MKSLIELGRQILDNNNQPYISKDEKWVINYVPNDSQNYPFWAILGNFCPL